MNDNKYVDAKTIAKMFQLTVRRIQQLTQDGVIDTVVVSGQRARKYDLVDTVQKYIKFLQDKAYGREEKEATGDLVEKKLKAEIKYKEAKAKRAEVENAEIQGGMHRAEDVMKVTSDLVMAIRAAILSLPGTLAVDCAGADTAQETAGIIKTACNNILNQLVDYDYDPEKYAALVKEREKWMNEENERGRDKEDEDS
jgi:phage terminase Nu1 subunit (DNA packaging protein)